MSRLVRLFTSRGRDHACHDKAPVSHPEPGDNTLPHRSASTDAVEVAKLNDYPSFKYDVELPKVKRAMRRYEDNKGSGAYQFVSRRPRQILVGLGMSPDHDGFWNGQILQSSVVWSRLLTVLPKPVRRRFRSRLEGKVDEVGPHRRRTLGIVWFWQGIRYCVLPLVACSSCSRVALYLSTECGRSCAPFCGRHISIRSARNQVSLGLAPVPGVTMKCTRRRRPAVLPGHKWSRNPGRPRQYSRRHAVSGASAEAGASRRRWRGVYGGVSIRIAAERARQESNASRPSVADQLAFRVPASDPRFSSRCVAGTFVLAMLRQEIPLPAFPRRQFRYIYSLGDYVCCAQYLELFSDVLWERGGGVAHIWENVRPMRRLRLAARFYPEFTAPLSSYFEVISLMAWYLTEGRFGALQWRALACCVLCAAYPRGKWDAVILNPLGRELGDFWSLSDLSYADDGRDGRRIGLIIRLSRLYSEGARLRFPVGDWTPREHGLALERLARLWRRYCRSRAVRIIDVLRVDPTYGALARYLAGGEAAPNAARSRGPVSSGLPARDRLYGRRSDHDEQPVYRSVRVVSPNDFYRLRSYARGTTPKKDTHPVVLGDFIETEGWFEHNLRRVDRKSTFGKLLRKVWSWNLPKGYLSRISDGSILSRCISLGRVQTIHWLSSFELIEDDGPMMLPDGDGEASSSTGKKKKKKKKKKGGCGPVSSDSFAHFVEPRGEPSAVPPVQGRFVQTGKGKKRMKRGGGNSG